MFKPIVCAVIASHLLLFPARAADIKVLTAGAFKSVLMSVKPAFEQQTGHTLVVDNDTAGALTKRVAANEKFDLLIVTPQLLQQLAQSGMVAGETITPLARVAIGMATKHGMPQPDISTVAAFKATLLRARRVAYIDPASGGSSGIYLAKMFEELGIGNEIRQKALLVPGGLVAAFVANGQADVGLHQISEIIPVTGADLVGPLPAALQNYTVYAAGMSSHPGDRNATQSLLDALQTPATLNVFTRHGMEAP